MQLQLNVERMDGYDTILDMDLFQEETMELIVPDSNADILRIVDVNGQIRLTGKNTHDTAAAVSAMLDYRVLYETEDNKGLCCIHSKMPITLQQESNQIKADTVCIAIPVLRGIDAKPLNPRKMLIRADVGVRLKLYQPHQTQLCTGISEEAGNSVQQLNKECVLMLVSDVLEKEFSLGDEIRLQAGPAGQAEILGATVTVMNTNSKVIGNKLVFKGEARTNVHYLVEDRIYCASGTIPFSQIMNTERAGESAECMVDLCLTALSMQPNGADGRTAGVTIDLLAQITMIDKRPVNLLCDAYSTKHALRLERTDYALRSLAEYAQCVKNVSETLQADCRMRNVISCAVQPIQVTQRTEQNDICLEGQFAVRAMLLDENGMTQSLCRNVLVTGRLESPAGNIGWLQCTCPGEVYVTAATDGIDVRFDVEFRWVMFKEWTEHNIAKVELDEGENTQEQPRACVVLRMPTGDEDLWQIAKCYQTTMESIRRANELEGDELPRGRMLLVPRGSN